MIANDTSVLDAALAYYGYGLTPIRLYGLNPDGSCQCGRPDCAVKNAGKHPKGNGWQRTYPQTEAQVREQFANHTGNIGIYLPPGRHVLIDADGPEGIETTQSFDLSPTLTQISGSGLGAHWIYKLADHHDASKITDRRFAVSVDCKVRGQFVAAPSRHQSGGQYEWRDWREPAVLPDSLYELLISRARPESTARPRTNGPAKARVAAYVSKMEPAIAGQGGHNATYRAACFIVKQGLSEEDELEILQEYNERAVPQWTEEELQHKLEDARRLSESEPLPNRPRLVSVPLGARPEPAWKTTLLFGQDRHGTPVMRRTVGNAVIILQNDERWVGRLRKDTFAEDYRLTDPPWADSYAPAAELPYWRDSDTARLQEWFIREWDTEFPLSALEEAVRIVAEANEYNSAKEWFDGLEWDGLSRVGNWLSVYLGCTDTAYSRAVGKWWLVSAVARVYEPGCKVDHMLILYGDQGRGKSSAACILAGPEWFSDTPFPIGNKDAYLAIQGKLIVEMAELESLNRSEATGAKSFISSQRDSFRPPYAKRNVSIPRRCVFIGTTNHEEMLRDETGDRRYWPVTVGDIDRAGLQRDREQIWAEVVHIYRTDRIWYPVTPAERELCRHAQNAHSQVDPWQSVISTGLELSGLRKVTVEHVLTECIRMPKAQWTQLTRSRVAKCLRSLGWEERNDEGLGGGRRRYYVDKRGQEG